MSSLESLINSPMSNVFRRAYIKRRKTSDGLYEDSWVSITPYVVKWGSVSQKIDDVNINKFSQSGISLVLDNNEGKFNPEDNRNSLWYGYLSRYGSLLKIEAGYKTNETSYGWGFPWGEPWGAASEYPTDSSIGIFLIDQEIPITTINRISLKGSSLQSIFNLAKPNEISGLLGTHTASEMLETIRDHTDGSGNLIFRQFISLSSWDIQTTTNYYYISDAEELKNYGNVWEFMTKLAGSEGMIVYIDRFGNFKFTDRTENTTTSQFSFYGQGFPKQNIISIGDYTEKWDKVYTGIRLKYLKPDTTTSYVSVFTSTVISPGNIQWKYGAKVYKYENTLIYNTATAQTLAQNLFNEFSDVKKELSMKTKLHPSIEVLDKVDVSYRSYDMNKAVFWGMFNFGEAYYIDEGENFDFNNKEFKILSKKINLDNFTSDFKLREV